MYALSVNRLVEVDVGSLNEYLALVAVAVSHVVGQLSQLRRILNGVGVVGSATAVERLAIGGPDKETVIGGGIGVGGFEVDIVGIRYVCNGKESRYE